MNFEFDDQQTLIIETARRFADNELVDVAAKIDQGDRTLLLDKLSQLAELGFMGLNVDSTYGGTDAGVVAFAGAVKALAGGCASTAHLMATNNMVAEIIQAAGTEEQKQRHIPRLCSGAARAGAFCLSETQAGSDPASMTTTATKVSGGWVLNGSKAWISAAEFADIFIVWAVTDEEAPKGKGISCFVIDGTVEGLHIHRPEKKLGQKGSCINPLTFDNSFIEDDCLMGELHRGYRIAVGELAGGRIGIAALSLGIATAAMDYARDYVRQRQQFGQAIVDFQGIQWMLADTYTELTAAELLTLQAAHKKECGEPYAHAASMAKLFASEAANRACYQALQLMGGVGYTQEVPLERHVRDVRITTIYEGTSEIQRMIIARELLSSI